MTDAIDLRQEQRTTLSALVRRFLPGVAVWAYGSRVKWTARPNSDLDLVAFATPAQRHQVAELKDALAESNLPFPVDLHVWDEVPERFREIIRKEYVVVQEAKEQESKTDVIIEWQRHEVSKLLTDGKLVVGDGYRAKNSELSQTGLPFARAGNINNGFQFAEADYFPSDALSRVGNKVSQLGDVVFTSKGTVGRFAFVREDTRRFVYSPQLCFWRSLDQALIQSRFLYYWMHGSEFFDQFKGVAGQTDMAEYVSLTDQRRMHMTLPPLPEQRAIAHILGTLDDKIELNRRMNETLEAMARALFKSWFVNFDPVRAKAEGHDPGLPKHLADLFSDSFEDSELGEIPKGWEVKAFADTIEIVGGGTPKTSVAEYWDGDIPWFSVVDAPTDSEVWVVDTEKKVTRTGVENSSTRVLPVGTTIISARGTVGRIALVGVPMAMNQSCYGLRGRAGVYGFFNYFSTRELVARLQQHAHGSVFDTITRDTLAGVCVVAPAAELIEEFEKRVASSLQRIHAGLLESRMLAALRDTLLPKLISGELRVKDAGRFTEKVG